MGKKQVTFSSDELSSPWFPYLTKNALRNLLHQDKVYLKKMQTNFVFYDSAVGILKILSNKLPMSISPRYDRLL